MQAYIAGSVLTSKTEWPRDMCLVVLFAGNNFNCPYSFTPHLNGFKEEYLRDLREVRSDVGIYSKIVDAVLFTGGEPCLQRQSVLNLAAYAKNIGLKAGIETNGSKPNSLKSLLKGKLLDFVAMDLKAPFRPGIFEKVTKSSTFFKPVKEVIDETKESLGILKKYEDRTQIEVRTTVVPSLIYKKEDFLEMASAIKDLECRWILQQFKPKKGLVNKKFESLNSPTERFLKNLKDVCLKKYPNLRIDVKTETGDYYWLPESESK